jgi:hypothetical protein
MTSKTNAENEKLDEARKDAIVCAVADAWACMPSLIRNSIRHLLGSDVDSLPDALDRLEGITRSNLGRKFKSR